MNTEHGNKGVFWRSPAGIALGVFLVVAGLLLILEHGAHILGTSPLLLLLAVCVGMHFFMHGGHGSHRDDDHTGHGKGGDDGR
jgi:hypothetical protein